MGQRCSISASLRAPAPPGTPAAITCCPSTAAGDSGCGKLATCSKPCVRRTSLEAIGGFDERFFLYSEDTDLCARLRGTGWRIVYEPAVTATQRAWSAMWPF